LRFKDHTQTHLTPWDSSGRVIGPLQTPLPHNTQHSRKTDIHESGEIRTRNPSRLAPADQNLSPRGPSDQLSCINPLNPELNPICYLLALLAHNFLHVSRIRVKSITIRLLMSYIYIYIYIWSTYS